MNQQIIKEFNRLISQIKFDITNNPSKKDKTINLYRLKQVQNVLNIIKDYKKEIKNGKELAHIKGVGKGSVARIDEILKTGTLSEITTTEDQDKQLDIMDQLTEIIGIGQVSAYEFVNKFGIKSADDLLKKYNEGEIELPHQIIMGLKYKDLVKKNIQRDEINQIKEFLIKEIFKIDTKLNLYICGSYRRNKQTSGDIDVLITHPDIKTKSQLSNNTNYLMAFVDRLKKDKFILDDITNDQYEVVYRGFCKYKDNPVRRIDIKYVPYDSEAFALLHYTGSDVFNQRVREVAKNLGYKLNEYGLYKGFKSIKCDSEKCILEMLGFEYIEPQDR